MLILSPIQPVTGVEPSARSHFPTTYMQTILGSGGGIGHDLARILPQYTQDIRLVSRNPKAVNATDLLMPADLTNPKEVDRAVAGSDVVYVTIGFQYNVKTWKAAWPPFIRSVIKACKTHQAKLVFFDNIYMYNPGFVDHMTEEAPIGPKSKKGHIRREVAQLITDEFDKGELTALIARSADFYGPSLKNSVLTETVFKPLQEGKKANWLGKDTCKHSYTYTPDASKATALLGNTEDAYKQVWHLPTASPPPTGKEWVESIARALGVEPKYQTVNKFMMRILGLFIPAMSEMVEMMYQYESDYIFDSSKFEHRFNFTPTPYEEGIKEIVAHDYKVAAS